MKYIVFDLEATCWKNKTDRRREIIEIGAVKVDENSKVLDEFNCFIKPVIHPMLSDFCKELTTIDQREIDSAGFFPEAISQFRRWIDIDEEYVLCSWGFYDKKQLENDSDLHQLDKYWIGSHVSLKHQHAKIKKLKRPVGLSNAMAGENIKPQGIHHRGIDDAKNISKIFVKYFDKWSIESGA